MAIALIGKDSHYIKAVYVDVIVEQIHQSTLSITRNPVEFGADVTDHAYVEPKRLGMHVVTSLGIERAFATYNNLVAIQETRMPFTLVTGLYMYKNLLIEAITATRSHETGQILDANVDLLEIIFSNSSMSTKAMMPVPDSPADNRTGETRDVGPQQLQPEEVSPSLLKKWLQGGGA